MGLFSKDKKLYCGNCGKNTKFEYIRWQGIDIKDGAGRETGVKEGYYQYTNRGIDIVPERHASLRKPR